MQRTEQPTFAERLRQMRQRRRVSQQVVADFCLVDVKSIKNYEAGSQQPTAPVLVRMAEYFGCSVDFLLGIERR